MKVVQGLVLVMVVVCLPLVGAVAAVGGLVLAGGEQGSSGSALECDTGGMTVTAEDGDGRPVELSETQVANAALVAGAGQQMGREAQVIALITALQESTLRNLANDGSFRHPGGSGVMSASQWTSAREVVMASMDLPHDGVGSDWDSIGLFQQRPSAGWGSVEEIMDPATSASIFYERLGQVAGWESMPEGQAAQAVQVSAFPGAYTRWVPVAQSLLSALSDTTCSGGDVAGGSGTGVQGDRAAVVDFALAQLGDAYVWAAEGPDAWDCSGLVQGAYAQAGVHLPHYSGDIRDLGTVIPPSEAQPGDVMWWPGHVAIYLGEGELVGAQGYSQGVVRIPVYGSPVYLRFLP